MMHASFRISLRALHVACGMFLVSVCACGGSNPRQTSSPSSQSGNQGSEVPQSERLGDADGTHQATTQLAQPPEPVSPQLSGSFQPGRCPDCFGPVSLPAISRDMGTIAMLLPEPVYLLGSSVWQETKWSFVLINAQDGAVSESIPLLTRAEVRERTFAPLNCCDDPSDPSNDEGCEPDACVPDSEVAANIDRRLVQTLGPRLQNANQRLGSMTWLPLAVLPDSAVHVDHPGYEGTMSIRVDQPWGGTFEKSLECEEGACADVNVEVLNLRGSEILLLRVTIGDEESETSSTQYFVNR